MSDLFDALTDEAARPCTHLFGQCGECWRCTVCEGHADTCPGKVWKTGDCCAEKARQERSGDVKIEEHHGKFWLMGRRFTIKIRRCPWCGKPVERAS